MSHLAHRGSYFDTCLTSPLGTSQATIAAHPCLTGIRVGVSVRFGVSESWVSVRVGVSVRARLRARGWG